MVAPVASLRTTWRFFTVQLKLGDLVVLKHAVIRNPMGVLQPLPEAPDYGVIIAIYSDGVPRDSARVMWFDRETGLRRGETSMTLELIEDLEGYSK